MSQPSLSQPRAPTRVLILGGSSEATSLARVLVGREGIHAILSLAGRTSNPPPLPVPARIGGFGGVEGLAAYLTNEATDILVDATHPFAVQMTRHAREAASLTGCRHIKVSRPPWLPQKDDDWREVTDMASAAEAIGDRPRRVFLTIGRLQLGAFAGAAQHHYLVRTIDPVTVHRLTQATFIMARGPFDVADEERLMREYRIEALVTKNSGGTAAAAKLEAARRLAIPVIVVRRPGMDGSSVTVEAALAAIEAHHAFACRGV